MPVDTVRPSLIAQDVGLCGFSPPDVLGVSNRFEMVGIDAPPIPTEMVHIEVVWHRFDKSLISPAMRRHISVAAEIEGTVATAVRLASPAPASTVAVLLDAEQPPA